MQDSNICIWTNPYEAQIYKKIGYGVKSVLF